VPGLQALDLNQEIVAPPEQLKFPVSYD